MKTSSAILLVILIVAGGAFFLLKSGSSESTTSKTLEPAKLEAQKGEAQQVTLSMKNSNYYPNTLTVQAEKPVELTLDKSVTGCFRSFTVKSLGVSKYSRSPEDTVKFTPTKKGTFAFACSMGMGYGKLIVE